MRAVANKREFFRESIRVLFTPYAAFWRGLRPPVIRPVGLSRAPRILRTLSLIVTDAARVEAPSLRVFDACYSYLLEYNLPVPKAGMMLASAPQPSTPLDPKSPASTVERPRSPARHHVAESRPSNCDRITSVKRGA